MQNQHIESANQITTQFVPETENHIMNESNSINKPTCSGTSTLYSEGNLQLYMNKVFFSPLKSY